MPKQKKNTETIVIFTKMTLEDSWNLCNSLSEAMGLVPDRIVPKEELNFDLTIERPNLYWVLVVLGFCLYILPGVYVLWYYRNVVLKVRFSGTSGGTIVAATATTRSKIARLVFDQFRHCMMDNTMSVALNHPQPFRWQ